MENKNLTMQEILGSLGNHCINGMDKARTYGKSSIGRYLLKFTELTYSHALAIVEREKERQREIDALKSRWYVRFFSKLPVIG